MSKKKVSKQQPDLGKIIFLAIMGVEHLTSEQILETEEYSAVDYF